MEKEHNFVLFTFSVIGTIVIGLMVGFGILNLMLERNADSVKQINKNKDWFED